MWVYVCVYARTHTHNACGVLGCEPRGRRRLESPNNLDGLNLGIYVFVYVYKVHICVYMLGGGMRSWTNCFFFYKLIFPSKKKSKRCEGNTNISNTHGSELHRPSIQGTKLLFKVIQAIIIMWVGIAL